MSTNHRHTQRFSSTCCYCGVGCGVTVYKDKQGRIAVEGSPDYPVNKGMLCSKGLNLHHTVNDRSDRLLHPQMRPNRNMPLQRVSWDTALNRAAAVLNTLIKNYGPDSIGFYISGQCLTEEYYVVNKLVKGFIGTNNLDSNSRLCMSSAVAGYKGAFGSDGPPPAYADLELADCILLLGSNAAACHPIVWSRIAERRREGAFVICADPRPTQTAQQSDLHLAVKPGTDLPLLNAMLNVAIHE